MSISVTQEQLKLSLEQWRLTTDNGDHSLELWRLIMEPMNASQVRRSHPEVL
jgi:hypothetical protein